MNDLSGPMALFLGYDPGGKGKHGVVSVRVGRDGTDSDLDAKCLRDTTQVKVWLCKHPTAVALGIDTLLAWSRSGARLCDDLLRERYNDSKSITFIDAKGCVHCENGLGELRRVQAKPEWWRNSSSVVSQNSLYSAMTLNGALVAMAARKGRPEFPLAESHPRLLLHASEGIGAAREHLVNGYAEALCEGKPHVARSYGPRVHEDHMADAFVAAWSASRWHFKQWTPDLYDLTPDEDYYFPAGRAVYPWPEPVPFP